MLFWLGAGSDMIWRSEPASLLARSPFESIAGSSSADRNITPSQVCKWFRIERSANTGCAHSNLDGPVGSIGDCEEFRCPLCGNQIARKLDALDKPTGESFIVVAV